MCQRHEGSIFCDLTSRKRGRRYLARAMAYLRSPDCQNHAPSLAAVNELHTFTFVAAAVEGSNRSAAGFLVPPKAAAKDAAVCVQESPFAVPHVQGPPAVMERQQYPGLLAPRRAKVAGQHKQTPPDMDLRSGRCPGRGGVGCQLPLWRQVCSSNTPVDRAVRARPTPRIGGAG